MQRPPRPDKVAVVEEVQQRFAESEAVLLAEYRGLNVTDLAKLRTALIEADARLKIYKNTLVRRATADTAPDGLDELLLGPVALAFTQSDPVPVAKALRDFAAANNNLVLKGGVLSGRLIDAAAVAQLATLPPRLTVLSEIAGGLAAPLTQLAQLLSSLLGEFSGLLTALVDQAPEGDAEPAAADDAEVAAEPEAEAQAEPEPEAAEPEAAAEEPEPTAETSTEDDPQPDQPQEEEGSDQ